MLSEVSIIKCREYSNEAVYRSVRDILFSLGGMARFVKKGERILLKPNLLTAKPIDAAVTTHPSVVRALALLVREAGGVPLIGDSPGRGQPGLWQRKKGCRKVRRNGRCKRP